MDAPIHLEDAEFRSIMNSALTHNVAWITEGGLRGSTSCSFGSILFVHAEHSDVYANTNVSYRPRITSLRNPPPPPSPRTQTILVRALMHTPRLGYELNDHSKRGQGGVACPYASCT